jgi:prepilin signal peptidase PulO-like enzyme (type II secretory pathway)
MEIIGILLLGWVSGWIINYLADVLPVNRKFTKPVCLQCAASTSWQDYVLIKPCQSCGRKRTRRTWLVQILLPLIALYLFLYPPARLGFWIGFGLVIFFGVVAVIDVEYRAILLPVNIFGLIIGFFIGWMIRGPVETILGGLAGFLLMLSLYYLGILFNRVVGRIRNIEVDEVALGFGDVYLMGGLGLMMGWPEVVGGLLIALILGGFVSGLIILVTWMAKRYEPLQAIPYAPFFIIAAVIMIYLPKQ